MRQDKALLTYQGLPLLQHIHQVASSCVDQVYVVGPVRASLPADWQYLAEAQPHQGPLLAFQQGLAQVSTDWVLLLACDMPFVDPLALRQWQRDLALLPDATGAYLAVSAKPGPTKTYEALCGFYRDRCRTSLAEFITNGGRSFQGWLAQVAVAEIPHPNPQLFTNWNSPADLSSFTRTS
jgi:molybdenum cofactor guanylyltransferase